MNTVQINSILLCLHVLYLTMLHLALNSCKCCIQGFFRAIISLKIYFPLVLDTFSIVYLKLYL